MRRSKIQRQEERRERLRDRQGRRVIQKEAAQEEQRFMVVRSDDCRVPKYLHKEGGRGFEETLAIQLAEPVPAQMNAGVLYDVVPLHVFHAARDAGEPISAAAALTKFPAPEAE